MVVSELIKLLTYPKMDTSNFPVKIGNKNLDNVVLFVDDDGNYSIQLVSYV